MTQIGLSAGETTDSSALEVAHALDIARALAAAGIPIFLAWPDPGEPTGYKLPLGWQSTVADPAVVNTWQPGMALAAVMGHGLDLLDVDAHNGGDPTTLGVPIPVSYGAALTPSGGMHSFIRSTGVRSKNGVRPGIDVKAGAPDGKGRGFAFIAPTVRVSKTTGQPTPYRWVLPPDLPRLAAALQNVHVDTSGLPLANLIEAERQQSNGAAGSGSGTSGMTPEDFMRVGPWANIEATLAEGRNNGVARLAAALRGRGGWRVEDAVRFMYAEVWPRIDQGQGGHEFGESEFETTIRAAWRQYPDGQEQRAAEAAVPPAYDAKGQVQPPSPTRYFSSTGALLAATLAADVQLLGPLSEGVDDRMWAYHGGVWRPSKSVVRDRVSWLMGERYRPAHARNAEDIVRAQVQKITCEPIADLINFRNGLLDWRTGELRPHAPEVPSTVQLNTEYVPIDEGHGGSACPAFEKFLAEVLPPDMVEVVWELIGYLMYSGNPLHKAVMLTGTGRNGKGTFLRAMVRLLGSANITTVSLHDLVNTRFTTASLFGKLANIAGDIDAGYLENTATFKGITGGDMISAEHKGRDRFDFSPWAVPVFSANKIPASADTTVGYLSRWLVVPFPHDFTGHEDRFLDGRLTDPAELRGIAARAVAALPRLLARGDFEQTESGRAASDEFMRRVDQVRTWIADCADVSAGEPHHPWANRTDLYRAYQMWAARDGHRPVKASEFYDRVESAGAEPAKVHGIRGYNRIRVIDNGWGPQGAQGAGNPTPQTGPVEVGAGTQGEGAGTAPKLPPAAETQDATEVPAPTKSPGQGGLPEGRGQRGQIAPTPPRARNVQVGGWAGAAPSAPKASGGSQGSDPGPAEPVVGPGPAELPLDLPARPETPVEAPAKARAAEKRAQLLAERITEASGEIVPLPAAVNRAGAVTPVSLDEADLVLASLVRLDGALTVDVEHTGYPVGHRYYALRTVQLGNDDLAIDLDAADPAHLELAAKHLAAAPVLHAHSATADLVPLDVAGVLDAETGWAKMFDTVIPALLADPASTGNQNDPATGLKELSAGVLADSAVSPAAEAARSDLFKAGRWLKETEADTELERSGWAQADPNSTTMIRYAGSDVLDTAAIAKRLPWPAPDLLERERIVQRMTARITHRGIRIDGDHVRAMRAEHGEKRAGFAEQIAVYGIDNPGSAPQVAGKLTELGVQLPHTKPSKKFPNGQPSVAEGVLEELRSRRHQHQPAVGDLIDLVLDYRHHNTVLSLFLEPYRQLVDYGDGRARPTIYTLGTDTGRMSCTRPNLQQLSRVGGVRACLTADPGHLLIGADFKGVELRVAAALSGDPNLRQMIAEGIDLHWLIARQVFGENATKGDRYMVKRGVFGRIYGGGIQTLARQLGVPDEVAAAMVATLDHLTPGLTAWSRRLREDVQAGMRQFPTYAGRVIHLPPAYPHKAPNYAIQGTARELLVDALLRWRTTRWGDCTLWPVHDELDVMVPEAEAEEATTALVGAMQSEIYGVPILVEASEPSFEWKDAA